MTKPSTRPARVAPDDEDSGSPGDRREGGSFPVVAIGASAGGLSAISSLLKHLPPTTGMAFVFVQHLDPSFVAEALSGATEMAVRPVSDAVRLEPNHVYVIPADDEIDVRDGRLAITPPSAEVRRPHVPVDSLFRALAADHGNGAIGVVLSGSSRDGSEGLRAIKEADGITLAQRPETAKYDCMPRSAIEAGVVDYCLPLAELAEELVCLSAHPYVLAREPRPPKNDEILAEVLATVFRTVGVDFTEYNAPSLERRLARRMALRRVDDLPQYLGFLRTEPDEARHLYEDILVHVTEFFRDPEVFEQLKERVLPQIMRDRAPRMPIRVWVAGCSTGQEVYSIAIALLELVREPRHSIQIFGSDVSSRAIEKARSGLYSESEMRGVSEERRARFFRQGDGGYRVVKAVRELCVFAEHDLARDPPFSRLDLVTCRNVLMYFGKPLQERLVFAFHYALRQQGFLLLGRGDSAKIADRLFVPVDAAAKIFTRTPGATTVSFGLRPKAALPELDQDAHVSAYARANGDMTHPLDRLLVSRFAPPGVLINERLEVLQFYGQTGPFLEAPPGDPQSSLIKMARDGLAPTLHATIARARKTMTSAITADVNVEQDGFTRTCNVVVLPCAGALGAKDQLYVVLFEEPMAPIAAVVPPANAVRTTMVAHQRHALDELARVSQLERELAATRQYLEAMIRQHGDTTDDLGSANEELMAGNEELQSVNEELETAKEALQSMNEELTTVNDELRVRNQHMARINDDLVNILNTVEIPIVILGKDRRIRRFTPDAQHVFNLIAADVERPFQDIRSNLALSNLDAEVASVIARATPHDVEVKDRTGRWYRLQIRPYCTADGAIDGAILSLVDIDALKRHVTEAQEAAASADRARATLSHELRAPLSTVLHYAQRVRRGDLPDGERDRTGEAIEREVEQQVRLIEELLECRLVRWI